jgi:hypothetical protein
MLTPPASAPRRGGQLRGRPPGGGPITLDPQAEVDWQAWHAAYEDPDSILGKRLALVRSQVRAALDAAPPGPIRALSVCAGQGHDLIGAVVDHPRREDVSALLVELDARNVELANAAARAAGLAGVRAVARDASLSDAYAEAAPADLVLVCGVFGNVSAQDALGTVEHLPELCAAGAAVVWTRHRNPPDLVPQLRERFEQAGFSELAGIDAPPFWVGVSRLHAAPRPLQPGVRLFRFIGHDALWPHLDAGVRAALGALFRPDCSLLELVEAMRALPVGLPSEATAQSMLREARGTADDKHRFLADVICKRFPQLQPQLVHRVYTLDRARAAELYGQHVAAVVPAGGLTDIHTYLTLSLPRTHISDLERRTLTLDVTVPGEPWDGSFSLPLACGPGEDQPAGSDPEESMRLLVEEHCDPDERSALMRALAELGRPA